MDRIAAIAERRARALAKRRNAIAAVWSNPPMEDGKRIAAELPAEMAAFRAIVDPIPPPAHRDPK